MNVERQKHIFVRIVCGLVLTAALAAGITWAVRHDRAMHGALRELREWNLADMVFRSDSAAQVLVDYFDHPWHSANDQMLAYYLLGRQIPQSSILNHQLKRGIYIRDGKKVVVK